MKGQVTIFILLGFMMLIVFGFLFFLIVKTDSTISYSELDTSPLIPYLQSCLDSSITSSLEILGEGGGFLFKGHRFNPLKDDGVGLGAGNYLIYDGKLVPIYFNKSTIPNRIFPLICKENQPSGCSIAVTSDEDVRCDCTCDSTINDCDNSLQNYLELSVEKKFISCYGEIPELFPGMNTNLILDSVDSFFSSSTVDISLYSKLKVGSSDNSQSISLPPISSTSIRLSLVSVRELFFDLFQDDLDIYDFNLLREINESILGVSANRYSTSLPDGKNYWVTELTFSNSAGFLAGKPFHWYYATEKRDPHEITTHTTTPISSITTCYDWDDMVSPYSC